MVSGAPQTGTVGARLAAPLVVLVTDDKGSAVKGESVSWAAQGGGSVSSATVKTGSNGRASAERILGPTPGPQTTTASVAGLEGSPVTFEATATEGPPPPAEIAITNNPPTSALDGEVFAPIAQPAVRVTDATGPVANVQVTATIVSGGGTLEGNGTATTNANGDAVFGDLGISGTGDQTLEFTAGAATVQSSPVTISALSSKATTGEWGPVVQWDIVPLHMSLLPNGKIFAWGKREVADTMGMPRIWDPAAGPPIGLPEIHVGDMLFCAGHTLLPDGRLMVAGGHHMDDAGIPATYFFSQAGAPQKGPDMSFGRWYPTLTVLPNGSVLSMAGRNEAGNVVRIPELWNGSGWAQLTGADTLIPYYPRNFVDPIREGQVFYAGERIVSRWFDYRGSGSWTTSGPAHIWKFNRDYGTAVMYDTGKILYAGGGGDQGWSTPDKPLSNVPAATAEMIDLNQASPTWQAAGSMSSPRRHLNGTILPDGQVLITGGLSGGGFNNMATAVRTAEIWNPETMGWTTLAAGSVRRGYHSVSLLLPDGSVLHGASGDAGIPGTGGAELYPAERNHEIFSPPYAFKGARPSISSAPGTVGYRETFSVATPNAAQIESVRWIRLGSVTHAFDMSQRANTLPFTRTSTGVDITAPDNAKLAPPGHYMLFILNRNGVPSAGKIMKVE